MKPVALGLCAAMLLALVGTTSSGGEKPKISEDRIKKIEAALPDKAPASPAKDRKVLIFTLAKGYVHGSIPTGAKTLEMMGKKTGAFEAVISNDVAMFEPDNIKKFDAIVMVSTTGDIFPVTKNAPLEQQAKNERLRLSLLEFISSGKGIVGIHAASDSSYQWPEYGKLIGGYFNGHPWGKITMKIDDSKNPINACFKGMEYAIEDEIYTFKEPYSREKLHILLSINIEKSGIKSGFNRKDNDYAVSWIQNFGKGRVFYCSLGHRDETYWNPMILQHYLAGIQFALGDLSADATPSGPLPKAP